MSTGRILIVDDEQGVRSSLAAVLEDEGFEVETVSSGEECLATVDERRFQAILLDIWMPGLDGLETLKSLRRRGVDAAIIMISGHGTIETAVRATRLGAHDFVEKPLSLEKILLTLKNALRARKLEERNRLLREELRRDTQLIGESVAIKKLREQIDAVAPTSGGVLVTGEGGSGKDLVARLIHARSLRAEEAFIELACSALQPDRALVELLGRAGGQDPARPASRGKLELAAEGTLFLHEVWALPPEAQTQLVRALETGRFLPIDSSVAIETDARPIAASGRDLPAEIAAGRFREDLFFKLSIVPLVVPALRERREDVPLLVEHFLERYGREYDRAARRVEPAAMEALTLYPWPGNVRELRNLVERLVILTPGETITLADLPASITQTRVRHPQIPVRPATLREGRVAWEAELIRQRLEACGGNITRAAQSLGIERSHLYRKMKTHGIRTGPDRSA